MALSYRVTSGAALLSLALPILDVILHARAIEPRSIPPGGGAVGWDLCYPWPQRHPMYKLIVFV